MKLYLAYFRFSVGLDLSLRLEIESFFLLTKYKISLDQKIDWQEDSDKITWAYACDFYHSDDVGSVKVSRQDCGRTCMETNACTHFSWTKLDNYTGTCWMKNKGIALKDKAKSNNDHEMICGMMPSKI